MKHAPSKFRFTRLLKVRHRSGYGTEEVSFQQETRSRPGSAGGRGRSLALQAVLLAVLLGAVALVITEIVPGSSQRLRHPAAGWITLAVILELIACASYVLLFHGVFSQGAYRISHVRSAQIGVGELGAFVVVPTGAGGPALRIWALLRSGMPFAILMRRSVIHAVVFNLPYVLAAILLGLSVTFHVAAGHAPLALALAPLGLVIGTLILAVAAARFARRRPSEPETRWGKIGHDVIRAIPAGLREFPARLRQPQLPFAAIGYWAGDCTVLIACFYAARGSAPVSVVVLAYMLGQLGNALPLPGGVGAVEPAMLGVLTASGIRLGLGAAAVVLYRFISVGLQATAGTIAVATLVPALQRVPSQGRQSDGRTGFV